MGFGRTKKMKYQPSFIYSLTREIPLLESHESIYIKPPVQRADIRRLQHRDIIASYCYCIFEPDSSNHAERRFTLSSSNKKIESKNHGKVDDRVLMSPGEAFSKRSGFPLTGSIQPKRFTSTSSADSTVRVSIPL